MLESFQVNDFGFSDYETMNDHLQYIDFIGHRYTYKTLTVNPDVAYRYQGNLFGLFKELNLNPNLYLYTLHLNGFSNPVEFKGDLYTLKIAIRPPIPIS